MNTIRPYRLFTLLESSDRAAHVNIPYRRGAGGTSLLETMLIIAALKIVDAKRVFEIGTFLGSNTYNMAMNLPSDARIFTLDLDEQEASSLEQLPEDATLTKMHLASKLDFANTPEAEKITALLGNSTTFDYSKWNGTIDLTFIDGGHDYDTVRSDTDKAFKLANPNRPSCILWHDYGNREYPDLTRYMNEITEPIHHIGDTMLCVWFNEVSGLGHKLRD